MIILCNCLPAKVQAYSAPGWTRIGEDNVYNMLSGDINTNGNDSENDAKEDSIIKHMSNLTDYTQDQMNKVMTKAGTMDLSISSLVLGRAGGYDISIGKFELSEDNPYGLMSAKIYVVLRNVMYVVYVIRFFWSLFQIAIHSGKTNRQNFKSDIETMVMNIVIVYFIPVLYNWTTTLRDYIIYFVNHEMTGAQIANIEYLLKSYANIASNDLVTGIVRLAYKFAGLFYIGNYVLTAMISLVMFVLIPFVLIFNFNNKKLVEGFISKLFTNSLIPFIDYVLLMAPIYLASSLGFADGDLGGGGENLAYGDGRLGFALITVVIIWSIIPARTAVMNALGNNLGAGRAGNGFGALAMLAMRGLGGMGRSAGGSGASSQGAGGILSDLSNAERFRGMEQDLNRSLETTKMNMDALQTKDNLFALDDNKETYMRSLMDSDRAALEEEKELLKDVEAGRTKEEILGRDSIGEFSFDNLEEDNRGNRTIDDELFNSFNSAEEDVDSSVLDADNQQVLNIEPSNIENSNIENSNIEPSNMETMELSEEELAKRAAEEEAIEEQRTSEAYNYLEERRYDGDELYGGKDFDELEQGQQFDKLRYENLKEMDKADRMIHDYDKQIAEAESAINTAKSNAIDDNQDIIKTYQDKIQAADEQKQVLEQGKAYLIDQQKRLFPNGAPEGSNYSEQDRATFADFESRIALKTEQIDACTKISKDAKTEIDTVIKNNRDVQNAIAHRDSLVKNRTNAQNMYDQRKGIEQEFASKNHVYRGEGTQYDNAASFRDSMERNELVRKQTTFRNFDSSPSAGILSPEAKAKFAQERAMHTGVKMAVNAVAKPAAMAVGAVAMAAGGQQASLMGAMAGSMVVDKVETTVEQGSDYYRAKGAYNYSDDDKQSTYEKKLDMKEQRIDKYEAIMQQRRKSLDSTDVKGETKTLTRVPSGRTKEEQEAILRKASINP